MEVLDPLASQDAGKVPHGAAMQMHHNAAAAAAITTSNTGQAILCLF